MYKRIACAAAATLAAFLSTAPAFAAGTFYDTQPLSPYAVCVARQIKAQVAEYTLSLGNTPLPPRASLARANTCLGITFHSNPNLEDNPQYWGPNDQAEYVSCMSEPSNVAWTNPATVDVSAITLRLTQREMETKKAGHFLREFNQAHPQLACVFRK